MNIKILGSGCAKCAKLEALTKQALGELNQSANVEKIADLNRIVGYGVMMTPGLVIDEKVKTSGKIPSIEQIKTWIMEAV